MQSTSVWELLQQVGWTMVPIYLCSVFAAAVAVRKLMDFRAAGLRNEAWLKSVLTSLDESDLPAARRAAKDARHPAAPVVVGMMNALEDKPSQAESEAQRIGLEAVANLEKNLRPLALVAEIAPLLGLLGTVVGMVELFMGIQEAQSGGMAMATLSGGIWKALLTTAAGLTVAVPALAVHAYLTSRVDRFKVQLTSIVQRVRYAYATEES